MSIDYSDMAFPKPVKRKKKKKHMKSILRTVKGICYICANDLGDYSHKKTEEHHIRFGSGLRDISEAAGLIVNLCIPHHRTGPDAAHNNKDTRIKLCRIAQTEFEKTNSRAEWMRISGRNYL